MGMLLPEASSAQCAAVARQGAYSEKRPGRPSQRAVLFGGPAFSAVPCCFFQSGGHATVPARGQKDIQNISNQLYFNYRYGTINPTHNLPLLPMRTYRYCQKGRNGYLRICRCVCSFLISKLANLLGGYSYVASFTHSVANCFLGVTCCNIGFAGMVPCDLDIGNRKRKALLLSHEKKATITALSLGNGVNIGS